MVVAGGDDPPDTRLAALLPAADVVIAADSGLDHALTLGLAPSILVGDLDSISPAGLTWATRHGVDIHQYPAAKDATDLELALDVATGEADEVVVVDPGVGRIDHALGNLLLLGSARYAGVRLSARLASGLVTVVRDERALHGAIGDPVSLFAVAGPARGVTTSNLRWSLEDATLQPGSTLGTSNELTDTEATVIVREGTVLAVQPEPPSG